MKIILVFILSILHLQLNAQDSFYLKPLNITTIDKNQSQTKSNSNCDFLIEKTHDSFSGDSGRSMTNPIIISGKNKAEGLEMWLQEFSNGSHVLEFITTSADFGCTDRGNLIYFRAKNSLHFKTINQGKFSCDGKSVIYFDKLFQNEDFKKFLLGNVITGIRITSVNSYYEIDIPEKDAMLLYNSAHCMLK